MKKRLTVLALAFAMVLTMSATVFAAGSGANSGNNSGADSYSETEASLVKYLVAPEGLTVPNTTFTFNFEPADGRGLDYSVDKGDYSSTTATISYDSADTTDPEMVPTGEEGNLKGSKTIESIFANYDFPKAGEYTFAVTEVNKGTEATVGDGTMTYSNDSYTLRLIVDRNDNITDVTVENTNPSSADKDKKVDPTDVTPENNNNSGGDKATPADSLGGFTFTNNYTEDVTEHKEPTDPNPSDGSVPSSGDPSSLTPKAGAFVLDKFVLGNYGDETKEFKFNVTVTLPQARKDFSFTDNAPTVTADKGSVNGTWEDGEAVEVVLKHDGQLNFPKLPVGTKITVAENDYSADSYTTAYVSSNNDSPADVVVTKADGGYVICRNTFDDNSVTPTGIIINNLPYVLLIGLALGGIVLFSRKRRYE